MSVIRAVIGVSINSADQILISLRPDHKELSGFWELPGGKIEPQESSYQALCREWREELGVAIVQAHVIRSFWVHYQNPVHHFELWHIQSYRGQPVGHEGQQIKWVPRQELDQYVFPQASRLLIQDLISGTLLPLPADVI